MWYHLVLWLIVIFIWWKWRGEENLNKVNPEGKYIFITGCDSGFGKLAAITFDRRGFQVIAGCLTEKGAKELKEESSAHLQTVQLDVTNSDNIKQVAEQVKNEVGPHATLRWVDFNSQNSPPVMLAVEFWDLKSVHLKVAKLEKHCLQLCPESTLGIALAGRVNISIAKQLASLGLWGLINNAGIMGPSAPTDWLRVEHFRGPIEVNLIGLINVTLNMLPLVKKAKGRIVNVTSVGGILTICSGGYCPSKYGAEAFTNNLRQDMMPFGVKVSCIQPGLFKTDLSDRVRVIKEKVAIWNSLPSIVQRQYGEHYLKEDALKKEKLVRLCQNSDLSLVVKCMEHALMSKYPKNYYSSGTDAKYLWIPLSKMPTFIQDYALMKNKVRLFNPNSE